MATFKIQREAKWSYGTGPFVGPFKYIFRVDLVCTMSNQTTTSADFSLTGKVYVTCNANDQMIPFRASDYAVLSISVANPYDYPFSTNTSYFQRALPFVPGAPQSFIDDVVMQFRGDIIQGDGTPHYVSLYVRGQGVVLNTSSTVGTQEFNINTSFTLPLSGDETQPVLLWTTSGADNDTTYYWAAQSSWASIFDFDYRPGMTWNGTAYMSHNRSNGGVCSYWDGAKWEEMRTEGYPDAKGRPPLLYRDGDWYNMAKIGENADS